MSPILSASVLEWTAWGATRGGRIPSEGPEESRPQLRLRPTKRVAMFLAVSSSGLPFSPHDRLSDPRPEDYPLHDLTVGTSPSPNSQTCTAPMNRILSTIPCLQLAKWSSVCTSCKAQPVIKGTALGGVPKSNSFSASRRATLVVPRGTGSSARHCIVNAPWWSLVWCLGRFTRGGTPAKVL